MQKSSSKILSLCFAVALTLIAGLLITNSGNGNAAPKKYKNETRGLWIAFCDFEDIGLANKSKKKFTENLGAALTKAKKNGTNTIYWHARAFDDATWRSKTFKACTHLTKKASDKKTAYKTYKYDPLGIAVKLCKKRGLRIEAWLNPYRIDYEKFLDPASSLSTSRIQRVITELKNYDLNGIHFDDYFYNSSTKKYLTPSKKSRYDLVPKGTINDRSGLSPKEMKANVNKMLKTTYLHVHKIKNWVFGISPAGNVDICTSIGADVAKWLRKPGFADYVAPQIYWSDNWGETGDITMFSDRLDTWYKMWKTKKVKMYIGLAMYKAGCKPDEYNDFGWSMRDTNIKNQVKKLRKKGCNGYILFEGNNVYAVDGAPSLVNAAKELKNLKEYLKKTKSI